MNRAEHLEWAKNRALEFCDSGNVEEAFSSLASDLNKHDDTRGHIGIHLLSRKLFSGMIKTADDMREEINEFH